MRHGRLAMTASLLFVCLLLVASPVAVSAIEEGEITGQIERRNDRFLRDYQDLDYKGQPGWETWARGLSSLGWIVVKGDSGATRDRLVLVIDTRTEIAGADEGRFADLRPGDRVRARYRMGWDALHAVEVEKLKD